MSTDTRTLRVVVTGDSTSGQKALTDTGKAAEHTESRIGSLAKGMGSFAIKGGGALLTVAGAAGALGLKTAAGFEQAHVGFTTMLGSGKKADAFIQDMSKFAAQTPFAFPDLVTASQRMLAMGFAAKDVKPTLTAVGDAVAAMGGGKEQIDQVTMALGQMQAKGKVAGDEVLQLTEAGIPVLKILAAQYHVSTGKMQEMITKGKVLSSDAIPKLVEGMEHGTKATKAFGGMMAQQSKTLVGQWSNLQDTVTTGLAHVVEPFMPMIKQATSSVTTFMSGALTRLATYTKNVAAPAIQNFKKDWDGLTRGTFGGDARAKIMGVADAIRGFFNGTKGAESGKVKADLQSLRDSFAKLGPLVKQLRDDIPKFSDVLNVGATAMKFLADHSDALRKALPYLAAGFILVKTAQVASNAAAAVAPAFRIAEYFATKNLTRSNLELAASLRANVATTEVSTGVENVSMLTRIRSTAAMVAQKVATLAASAATKAWTVIQAAFSVVMKGSLGPIGIVITTIAALVAGVIYAYKHFGWFKTAVDAAWKGIKAATSAVASWFMTWVWPTLKRAFDLTRAAIMVMVNVWIAEFKLARSIVMAVVNWVRNTGWPILSGAFNLMKNAVISLWNTWKSHFDSIKSKIETVMNGAKLAFSKAKDSIGNTWSKLKELAKEPVNFVIQTVYNNGIRKFWNAIATKVGAKPLDTIARLAGGGRGIPSMSSVVGDWVPFYGQAGEYVLNRKQVAKAGGWQGIESMFGPAGRDGASSGHYDGGGILGGIGKAGSWLAGKAKDLVKGSLLKIAAPLINTIKAAIQQIPGHGDIADAVRGLPTKALDSILAWIKPKDKADLGNWNGTIAPGVIGKMQQWALGQRGKTYLWSAVGPSHYDCSGMVGNLWAIATGNSLYRRYMSTSDMGVGRHGMVSGNGQFTVFLNRAGGHTAADVGGLHVEAYGGNGTPNAIGRIGTRLSFYNERLHLPGLAGGGMMPSLAERLNSFVQKGWPEPPPGLKVPKQFKPLEWRGVDRAALYDSGGILPPGATLAINATGRNEYVTTEAPGGVTVNVTVQGNVTTEKDLAESIATEVRNALLRKANRNGGKTGLK
jgi:tape measure domain-containing protein